MLQLQVEDQQKLPLASKSACSNNCRRHKVDLLTGFAIAAVAVVAVIAIIFFFATSSKADNVERCVARLRKSSSGGEAELDQKVEPGVTFTKVRGVTAAWERDGVSRGTADWVVPDGVNNESPRILYLHGGGYEYYSPQDVYRPATSRLAKAAGMPLLAIDYRLSPEHRHPTQIGDAVAGLRWIAENGPQGKGKASTIFLAGDSAGGGLALALAINARDQPIPGVSVAGVTVVSPETDLTCSGESYKTRRRRDPMFGSDNPAADSMPQIYRVLGMHGEENIELLRTALISPLHRELHSLPPMQIHVGDAEVMLSDSADFAKKARKSGSHVELTVWPRMWHTFTQYSEGCGGDGAKPLQEALDAIKQQGEFLRKLAPKPSL